MSSSGLAFLGSSSPPSISKGFPNQKLHSSSSLSSTMMSTQQPNNPAQQSFPNNNNNLVSDGQNRIPSQPVPSSINKLFADRTREQVAYEGWLMKRGEHIRNWRPRYFVLFKDGALLGYKNKVDTFGEPLNVFTVKNVQVSNF